MRRVDAPQHVPQVTVVNPSPYAIEVEVAGHDREGWMQLGTMLPHDTSSVSQVIDQGESWIFRVHAHGVFGGDFAVSRASLVRSEWRVTIPPSVFAQLRAHDESAAPPANW